MTVFLRGVVEVLALFWMLHALVGIFRRFGSYQLTLRNVLEERRL
jgi:hypothetical protein